MIIRGLNGIKAFEDKPLLVPFFETLSKKVGATAFNRKYLKNKKGLLRLEKAAIVIQSMRSYAFKNYDIDEMEYSIACVLKILEVLSYGKLPFSQNERAVAYVSFHVDRVK